MRSTLRKIATVIWGRNPSPYNICVRFYAKIRQIGRADIGKS